MPDQPTGNPFNQPGSPPLNPPTPNVSDSDNLGVAVPSSPSPVPDMSGLGDTGELPIQEINEDVNGEPIPVEKIPDVKPVSPIPLPNETEDTPVGGADSPAPSPSWSPPPMPAPASPPVATPPAPAMDSPVTDPIAVTPPWAPRTEPLPTAPPLPPLSPPPPPPPPSIPNAMGGGPAVPAGARPAPASVTRPKKNWRSTILLVVLLAVLVGAGFWAVRWFLNRNSGPTGPITITYWGLWESEEVMREVFDRYEQSNPNVKVKYVLNSPLEYRQRLQNALAAESGGGPDIFRFHNTWVPMFKDYLTPVPNSVFTTKQFEDAFYLVAEQDLKRGAAYVGIPLMIDGLGLFYNEDIFIADAQKPPTNWDEFQEVATKLTVYDPVNKGVILQAGAALGTTANVDHWSDIVGVMMMQAGADLAKPNTKPGQEALTYYTLYTKTYKTWDETLPNSTLAFATGKLAMYLGPSWEAHTIDTLAKQNGKEIRFKILPIPQLPETNVTWASYWVEGVSSKSSNAAKSAAWDLLSYLSTKETMEQLYTAQSKVRNFGEVYSRVDMADQLKDHPQAGAFVLQAPAAKSWYLASSTTDKGGINEKIITYYQDAVNEAAKTSADKALKKAESGVAKVLTEYEVK